MRELPRPIPLDDILAAPGHPALRPTVTGDLPPRAADVLTVVDLDAGSQDPQYAARALAAATRLTVGVARRPWQPALQQVVDALTLTVVQAPEAGTAPDWPPRTARSHIHVPDPYAEAARITAAVERTPRAALALAHLLRINARLLTTAADASTNTSTGTGAGTDAHNTTDPAPGPIADALTAESLTYSALLAGPEFAAWRAGRPFRPKPAVPPDAVLLTRDGDRLRITLNRPDRRNALGHGLRDALIDALDVVAADPALHAELRGAGTAFCSGGDLDEFGTAADPATAHVVRVARSAGLALHAVRDRVTPYLHGACVGAGIEVPAFAARVLADPNAWFRLPELDLGLVPGAGGTVSITARIGRWRTAWLVLTGERLAAATALEWGLVDGLIDAAPPPPHPGHRRPSTPLLDVLARMRELIVLPGNDFAWSGWDDAAEALEEFDTLVAAIERGGRPSDMRVLFLPTGPLQELSLSSGWGTRYCELAAEFDRLFAAAPPET
ncbi:enoyl-CoA hydratase/isomerase family protein [Yinghuangia soli]|uniref:Enoyl-CoA hydratase/isomerase family protein n=1 Tax=Yinghuangia soli TaxID=2908204 RepID=A0AA41TZS7_9ACTN|nr:enoyl-CoA hydratase/isomerase family protein [Yinghuangia soli]MCF2525662.1 enoyl-CoA hydratase/isomerase family protein [Yinghuangia soli]